MQAYHSVVGADGQVVVLWQDSLGLLGGHHRGLDELCQLQEFLGGIGQQRPSPGNDERFLGLGQQLSRFLDIGRFGSERGVLLGTE